jgi:hypothetical protein
MVAGSVMLDALELLRRPRLALRGPDYQMLAD